MANQLAKSLLLRTTFLCINGSVEKVGYHFDRFILCGPQDAFQRSAAENGSP
jgi:hypothetical protein